MTRRWIVCILAVLVVLPWATAIAGPVEDAKAELAKLEKEREFTKKTIVPLMNCFAKNQPHLQYMPGDKPQIGRKYLEKMEYCITAYPDMYPESPQLTLVKNQVIQLLRQGFEVGKGYVTDWESFNKAREEKKGTDVLEPLKATIESKKRQLYEQAASFAQIQKDFKKYHTDFNTKYVEVRNKSLGR